jgi:hypothetical protein
MRRDLVYRRSSAFIGGPFYLCAATSAKLEIRNIVERTLCALREG